MLFEKREEGGWMSTPCSIWWNSTPLMPPQTRRSWERRRLPKLGDGENSGAVEPLLHARADAVDFLQFELEQDVRQVVGRDDD
jgi:hypothetical protein